MSELLLAPLEWSTEKKSKKILIPTNIIPRKNLIKTKNKKT
jgi:hypothetical protein